MDNRVKRNPHSNDKKGKYFTFKYCTIMVEVTVGSAVLGYFPHESDSCVY